MHILGLVFFSAAFLISFVAMAQLLIEYRARIVDALLGGQPAPEAGPPAEIYHFPIRQPLKIEWREAA